MASSSRSSADARWTIAALALVAFGACTRPAPPAAVAEADPLAPLRAFETTRRAEARFLEEPPSDGLFGPDPYDLAAVETLEGARFVGILRGRDEIVLLDASLGEIARAKTPPSPSAIAARGSDVFVTSELTPLVARYRVGKGIERRTDLALGDHLGARAVAVDDGGVVHVAFERGDRLVSLRADGDNAQSEKIEHELPRGPLRIVKTRDALFVLCLIDHTIAALPLDRRGMPQSVASKATIDGPFWSLAAIDVEGGALVVAGGVEDRPLDRRGGFFGFIDSFIYVWFVPKGASEMSLVATINASERGVVVPKAIAFARGPQGSNSPQPTALVTGYGSAKSLRLVWRDGVRAAPAVEALDGVPGTSALVATRDGGFAAANPLLDAWVGSTADRTRIVAVVDPRPRDARVRLGEALFFTDRMAPSNQSEGALSRFTCETCHFEGYVDGRTHHTGRGDVRATTKPLLGLFNNRPHFSRALDPDLSSVAENEFRVAGAHSGADPHFALDARDPWLRGLGISSDSVPPTELRLALMSFLMEFRHRRNPRAVARQTFDPEERAGALAFRDRCERCHEARAAADVPSSRVPFDRWEGLVFSDAGPLVWAKDTYEKTGVLPYVHDRGARVPSLRRLYKKRPYLTNGSAKTLPELLAQVRLQDDGREFSHGGGQGEALDDATIRALVAFLDLL